MANQARVTCWSHARCVPRPGHSGGGDGAVSSPHPGQRREAGEGPRPSERKARTVPGLPHTQSPAHMSSAGTRPCAHRWPPGRGRRWRGLSPARSKTRKNERTGTGPVGRGLCSCSESRTPLLVTRLTGFIKQCLPASRARVCDGEGRPRAGPRATPPLRPGISTKY